MDVKLTLSLYIFMLATFLGIEVIRGVSRLLHTPLMSLTNAISAITRITVSGRHSRPLRCVTHSLTACAAHSGHF